MAQKTRECQARCTSLLIWIPKRDWRSSSTLSRTSSVFLSPTLLSPRLTHRTQSTTQDASSRISFVHNPATPAAVDEKTPTSVSGVFSHLIANERLSSLTPALLLHALKLHVPSNAEDAEAQETFSTSEALTQALGDISLSDVDVANYTSYITSSRILAKRLDLAPGANAILINGRIVGPFDVADWSAGDFEDLE